MRVHTSPQWWWRILIVVAGVAGLYGGGYPITDFTTQTSVIAIGYYSGVLYWMHRRVTVETAAPRLRVAVVAWVLLSGVASTSSPLLHYVLPIMVFTDWLLFRPYGQARWRDLPGWMLFPLGYTAIALAHGALPAGRYPYPYLDPDRQGWPAVGIWVAAVTAGFALVGALLIAVDRLRRPKMSTQGY